MNRLHYTIYDLFLFCIYTRYFTHQIKIGGKILTTLIYNLNTLCYNLHNNIELVNSMFNVESLYIGKSINCIIEFSLE
ncbi:hypothetical protein SS13_contig00004-0003 [Streptococcus parauberis]|nr:hypothetical protein SS13_contig00004-0003 [Streptococcus parauberis]